MSSLPSLPDPGTVKDPASASDALSSALAAVATVSKQLTAAPPPGGELTHPHLNWAAVPFKELKGWIGQFHELLVAIAAKHASLVSWSVTVGTPFNLTLTVNFADKTGAPSESNILGQKESVLAPPPAGMSMIEAQLAED